MYKTRQRYRIFTLLGIFFLKTSIQIFSQNNRFQVFIISDAAQYTTWKDTSGKGFLVPLEDYISPLIFEVPYQSKSNFTGERLYKKHSFWVVPEAGQKLSKAQDSLLKRGLSLYFFDTYRPFSVTQKMWEKIPDERYAANPAKGSGHNRGAAIDLTIADALTGQPLPMPTGFDNFSDSAHHDFMDLSKMVLENRSLLKGIMEHFGFIALSTEWWHYSLPNAKDYPLLNLSFKELKRLHRGSLKK